jgi:pimeloyl-ACP methyl ester carboxylesterase
MPRQSSEKQHRKQQTAQPETVQPLWLLKAIAFTILAALLCGYLTFCLLFYQGQWQLVLHPTRATDKPESIAGTAYQFIRFGPDETATPQLTGWWIPSAPGGRYAHLTILFLPGADGSLRDSIPTLSQLHNLGINVFAFDYRGYGQSAFTRPSQQRMVEDADAAWQYLTASRSLAERQIVPYGYGVGASLATHLAAIHPATPALILDSPHTDLIANVLRDPRVRFLPVRLLFHEDFKLIQPLAGLKTPKLLLSDDSPKSSESTQAFQSAADPKMTVEFATRSPLLYNQTLTRFLDQYLPPSPLPQLVPPAAPSPTNPR